MMSDNNIKKNQGPDLSRKVFGGVLDIDNAGYYPGLELLNLIFEASDQQILPSSDVIKIKRRAHDFARRLVWDESFVAKSQDKDPILYDSETEEAVRYLFSCLQLPIPKITKAPGWDRAHFFPYTRSLIHWDARKRHDGIRVERRYLRGGGALAFHVLRKEPDPERLSKLREGFEKLFSDSEDSALEHLSRTLLNYGYTEPDYVEDKIEAQCRVESDSHEELLRHGVLNILEHDELSSVSRIRSLMNWTTFWLVLIQHSRANDYLSRDPLPIICDCGSSHPQLRRESQRCLKHMQNLILDAIDKAAEGAPLKQQLKNKLRGFFWSSAATIKLLNARSGRRHFVIGLELVETLVLAATRQRSEILFESFVDHWLYDKCRLVVGRNAAEKSGLLESFDASVFEDNENQLAIQMKAAGLLTEYSDQTQMVGTGGLL